MNKELNSIQEKKMKEYLNVQEKDLDKMQQQIYDMITLSMLTNEETAALLLSTFMEVVKGKNNQRRFKELGEDANVEIDITKYEALDFMKLQYVWAVSYASNLDENGKPKKKGKKK